MSKKRLYNVYDNGKLYIEGQPSAVIAEMIGINQPDVARYTDCGMKYRKRFAFEAVENAEPEDTRSFFEKFGIKAEEWDNTVNAIRKRVEWVKS